MIMKILYAIALAGMLLTSCSGNENNEAPEKEDVFAKGADISWVTEMEQKGNKFYNSAGQERECTALMKELGLNSIRLRVWVDPKEHGNWCNTADLVVKAKRAAELGMDVMVDFHYSDWWADPGQQHKPQTWKGLDLAGLKKALADHTKDVLNALKNAGVTPKWVQVGNEIRPGMLWDEDASVSGASYDIRACDVKGMGWTSTEVKYKKNFAVLGGLVTTGYKAVKEVFADAIVIVHLDNGYDKDLYTWFFDELKNNGGRWDMIGMSIYPYWTKLEHPEYTGDRTIEECIANVNYVAKRYYCDVMIVETGMQCSESVIKNEVEEFTGNDAPQDVIQEGKRLMSKLIKECQENTQGHCKGVFYWEPECRPADGYGLGAFTNDGKPTAIMEAFK